jgi:hypothetical protein
MKGHDENNTRFSRVVKFIVFMAVMKSFQGKSLNCNCDTLSRVTARRYAASRRARRRDDTKKCLSHCAAGARRPAARHVQDAQIHGCKPRGMVGAVCIRGSAALHCAKRERASSVFLWSNTRASS